MADYELRAEYHPGQTARDTGRWHIAPHGRFTALCRKLLDPTADTRPITDAANLCPRRLCGLCQGVYESAGHTPLLPVG